jgi:MFS family permease
MPPAAVDLADRCEDLYRSAAEHLSEREADLFKADIYGLSTFIYGQVDGAAEIGQPLAAEDFEHSEARLVDLEQQISQRMLRRTQRWYILGTVIGLLVAAVILGAASFIARGSWQQLFEGAIFGAAGALASVLLRMHRGALQVEATQDTHLVAAAALVRPLMGALFGSVVCALLLSGLLPIDVTAQEPDRFYYLATVAFIAGFAERWAPSLLELTGSQLALDLQTKEQTAST